MRAVNSMIIKGIHDYVVLLERNNPFKYEEEVTIVAADDFRFMQELYHELKLDKENQKIQIEKQNKYIELLEQRLKEYDEYNSSNRLITHLAE